MATQDNRTILVSHIRFFLERERKYQITSYDWFEEENETGLVLKYIVSIFPNISSVREFYLSFNYKMDCMYMQVIYPVDKPMAVKMLSMTEMEPDQMINLILEWFKKHV